MADAGTCAERSRSIGKKGPCLQFNTGERECQHSQGIPHFVRNDKGGESTSAKQLLNFLEIIIGLLTIKLLGLKNREEIASSYFTEGFHCKPCADLFVRCG